MDRIELQSLFFETKTKIANLIRQGENHEAAIVMDAFVQIQTDLIKKLIEEIK